MGAACGFLGGSHRYQGIRAGRGLAFGPGTLGLGRAGNARVGARTGTGDHDRSHRARRQPTLPTERTEGASRGPVPPKRRRLAGAMGTPRAVIVAICVVLVAGALGAVALAATSGSTKANPSSQTPVSTVSVASPRYTPQAAVGATDDYHCSLVNPHITQNSYVISSQFRPGSPEVHHAVLALVPPSMTAQAIAANAATRRQGMDVLRRAIAAQRVTRRFLEHPLPERVGSGARRRRAPKGTGISLPKGSLVIEQVHYNLLVGDKPVTNGLVLHTVPMSTPLLPMQSQYLVAPPNIPCPAGVTGPLCNYQASLTLPEPALRLRRRCDGQGHRPGMW